MTTVVLVFIAGALVAALSGVIGDEARGWLELAPRGILRLVAMRLPGDQRKTVYEKEWLPELLAILQEVDGRPITRLFVGIRFATSSSMDVHCPWMLPSSTRASEAGAARYCFNDGQSGVSPCFASPGSS